MISTLVTYINQIIDVLKTGNITASGSTNGTKQSIAHLETDGAKLADRVFPGGVIRIPAEQFALGEGYDTTQACTRLARVYAAKRPEYYNRAAQSTATRINRLEYRKALLAGLINVCKTPRRAQGGRE